MLSHYVQTRPALPIILFLALCLAFAAPIHAQNVEQTEQEIIIVERRPFRGFVRRDMAERIAKLAAELGAWEQAARLLAKEPDLHFINTNPASVPPLDGLARMIYSTQTAATGVEGFPPNQHAMAKIRLASPENPRKALLEALIRQDLLELYAQVMAAQRNLLERYDYLAAQLLPLTPATDGGRAEMHTLTSIINELIALDAYVEILPQYNHNWAAPEATKATLLRTVQLAPGNPLILTALAEILLQTDRPVNALEYIEQALRLAPNFARAHDVKGAILLRQRLPALAAQSFGKAIELSPRNSVYHMHRASAYLVLEEEGGMCDDFKSACSLEDCDGLEWARGIGRCKGTYQ